MRTTVHPTGPSHPPSLALPRCYMGCQRKRRTNVIGRAGHVTKTTLKCMYAVCQWHRHCLANRCTVVRIEPNIAFIYKKAKYLWIF